MHATLKHAPPAPPVRSRSNRTSKPTPFPSPQVAYHLALELLAESGLTVIATPYLLTFKHLDCARGAAAAFDAAVAELRAGGRAFRAPPGAPVVGVGHSNGALLHLLMGAALPGRNAAGNVLISFNNKCAAGRARLCAACCGLRAACCGLRAARRVSRAAGCGLRPSALPADGIRVPPAPAARTRPNPHPPRRVVADAIPIPGLLDSLRSAVNAGRGEGGAGAGAGAPPPPPAALLAGLAAALPPGVAVERRLVEAAGPAIEQLASVVGEVGDGASDFTPAPAESRALIRDGYAVPRSLLVRFEDDGIDESEEMAALLEGRGGEGGEGGDGAAAAGGRVPRVRLLRLPGSHITPCGADVDLGPAGAVGALADARAGSQADVRRMAAEVAAWVAAVAGEERAAGRGGGGGGGDAAAAAVGAIAGAPAAAS